MSVEASRTRRVLPVMALPGGRALAAWFRGRESRERLLIATGGAFAAVYLAYTAICVPLVDMRARALDDIATYETIMARVAASAAGPPRAVEAASNLPDTTLITDSANAAGLVIRRLEPENGKTAIELENADFAVLIDWLALMEKDHALRVDTIALERRPEPGVVSARISVER